MNEGIFGGIVGLLLENVGPAVLTGGAGGIVLMALTYAWNNLWVPFRWEQGKGFGSDGFDRWTRRFRGGIAIQINRIEVGGSAQLPRATVREEEVRVSFSVALPVGNVRSYSDVPNRSFPTLREAKRAASTMVQNLRRGWKEGRGRS